MSSALLVLAVAFGTAQQSARGYGQQGGFRGGQSGGFPGGFGGGQGSSASASPAVVNFDSLGNARNARANQEYRSHPEEDSTPGLWTVHSAVLTPGDKFTFKLKIQAGETLLAGATSDAFDPALAVEDSRHKLLTKNDDRSDGDQSPFIAYRFKEPGEYTLKVLSYHSISGGKFVLKMRSFIASDFPIGSAIAKDVHVVSVDGQSRVVLRITAQKGRIYDLRPIYRRIVVSNGSVAHEGTNLESLIGPTGVSENDYLRISNPDSQPVFRALTDGDFYAEFRFFQQVKPIGVNLDTDLREVATIAVKPTDTQKISFAPNELKLIELPVQTDQIIQTKQSIDGFAIGMSALYGAESPSGHETPQLEGDQPYGNNGDWAWFRTNVDDNQQIVRVFHDAGTIRFSVRSRFGGNADFKIENKESLPDWKDGVPLNNSLNIGDFQFFVLKASKSELMRVKAEASHFLPRLDLFRMNGDPANTLCDRRTHVATDDLYFPDAGTFIARLACEGNGGSGDFAMNRTTLKPLPYKLGDVQTLVLDGNNFGLFSADLVAGKRYQLVIDNPGSYIQDDLVDEDGQFLTSQNISFDKVEVHYFVPTKSGRHRLWLRGNSGTWHFRLQLHTAPDLGGG